MKSLAVAYKDLLAADTDMKAHLKTLHDLAKNNRVVEFGTRRGISTVAMLAAKPLSFITYDLERSNDIDEIEKAADKAGIPFLFVLRDIDRLERIEQADFVFLDAMHNGNSVRIQMELANEAGAKAIAIHDTELFGKNGDLEGTPGIFDAILDFVHEHKDWIIYSHNPESYGLTVLKRR